MDFLQKATALMPKLHERERKPLPETEPGKEWMGKGDRFTLDFGTHMVGYFHIQMEANQTPDSPLQLILRFAEMPCEFELELDHSNYKGGLSSTWIQQETIYLDEPEAWVELPRRYTFRYVEVILGGSTTYRVRYQSAGCRAISSVQEESLAPLPPAFCEKEPLLADIDTVAVRTLRDCMQTFFEDGPKRDRRLWLGDLYLQAQANYPTFRNNDLVLRCLYLFAGLPHEDGCLSSAVYAEPILKNQAWILHDYALMFIGTLADYYDDTKNRAVLEELWPTAIRQAEIVVDSLDEKGCIPPERYFIDWCGPLKKAAAGQGLALKMLKRGFYLAQELGRSEDIARLEKWIATMTQGALSFYDEKTHLFLADGQVSVASQMWMILAEVLTPEENLLVLDALAACPDAIRTVTPYAMHYYVQAMICCGRMSEAVELVKSYWGGMVKAGADCFWEVYVPGNPEASPYGDWRINSFCHAWSCTPTYFIRKYFVNAL